MIDAGHRSTCAPWARCTASSASAWRCTLRHRGPGACCGRCWASAPAVAGLGGWLALRWGGQLNHVFIAQGVALAVYGVVIGSAIAGGAWLRPDWLATARRRLPAAPAAAGLIRTTAAGDDSRSGVVNHANNMPPRHAATRWLPSGSAAGSLTCFKPFRPPAPRPWRNRSTTDSNAAPSTRAARARPQLAQRHRQHRRVGARHCAQLARSSGACPSVRPLSASQASTMTPGDSISSSPASTAAVMVRCRFDRSSMRALGRTGSAGCGWAGDAVARWRGASRVGEVKVDRRHQRRRPADATAPRRCQAWRSACRR